MLRFTNYVKRMYPDIESWAYNFSGFNQFGLRKDDLLYETPEVIEALRRLPAHVIEERNFRILRAAQLNGQKKILPKEQWTKFEEDEHYLLPYLQEVQRENQEKAEWDKE
ncbi:PREDICTED: cytochrome b-c1 complex subunit 7-like [Eufriesea mexicana]|uniref:cytochrome b-c1 complex subunit 7-like n=1 Tax=Eufriesea mexicana TaxID=516756 RepID=UPI00083BEDB6|nr:PREDICTED: cytochrome b-c1 complex subunit 7-like [Eufriesea mexicana]